MHTLTVDEQKTAQVPDAFMNRPIVSQGIRSEITAYARCIRSSPIYTSTNVGKKKKVDCSYPRGRVSNLFYTNAISSNVTTTTESKVRSSFEKSNNEYIVLFPQFWKRCTIYGRTLWRIDSLKGKVDIRKI